jgi:SAM-dependent methyltransferase
MEKSVDLSALQPTTRFSDRVNDYAKSRPSYPAKIIDFLKSEIDLKPEQTVADIGCGTGILAELFLKNGNFVYGVEPNAEMRQAARNLLAEYPNFVLNDGTAEDTKLPNLSMEFIAAGQAFHWFQREPAKREFLRILKPGGYVLLLWNERESEADRFQWKYEEILRTYGKEYSRIDHRNLDSAAFEEFFAPREYRSKMFPNFQILDFDGLKSRLVSSSYMPAEGQPNYAEMIHALKILFHAFEQDNRVIMKYVTRLYYGRLK